MALPATYDFAGTGSLSASWTAQLGTITRDTDVAKGGGGDAFAFWNADTFGADQYSQAKITTLGGAGEFCGVNVRARDTGSSLDNYYISITETTWELGEWVNNSQNALNNGPSPVATNSIVRIEVMGTSPNITIVVYDDSIPFTHLTDETSIESGSAGINFYSTANRLDDFEGGDLGHGVYGYVAASGDDVQFYYDSGSFLHSGAGNVIWFGKWNNTYDISDIRFTLDEEIPSGSTITAAYANLYGLSNEEVSDFWAYVVDDNDAPQTTEGADRPTWASSGNTVTYPSTEEGTGALHWTGYNWLVDSYNALTVTSLVQQLVNTYGGLSSGAHIRIVLVGDSGITNGIENGITTYDVGSTLPFMTIFYTAGGGVTGVGPHQSVKIAGNW